MGNRLIEKLTGAAQRSGALTIYIVIGFLGVAALISCTGTATQHLSGDFGESFHTGFSRQVMHPEAPADPAPAEAQPGELAHQIYKKRYIKEMTEEDKDQEESVSQMIQ